MCIVALAPMFIAVYFVCLLTMLWLVSHFRCQPCRCYLVLAEGFSPDTEMSIASHARVYIHSLPTGTLQIDKTAKRCFWPMSAAIMHYLSPASNHAISYQVQKYIQTAMSSFS